MYTLTQSYNQRDSPPPNIQHTCLIFSRIIYTCSKKILWQGPHFESSYSDQSDHPEKKKKSTITVPSCPEGSRKLRFPDYVTTAQDGGKVVSLTHRPFLPPGNTPGTHFR